MTLIHFAMYTGLVCVCARTYTSVIAHVLKVSVVIYTVISVFIQEMWHIFLDVCQLQLLQLQ